MLGIDAIILFFQIPQLSISFAEASLLYTQHSFLSSIEHYSLAFFGHNDYSLRVVMVFFHLASAYLLYQYSKEYVKKGRDRLWLVLFFLLLPGSISASLVVNHGSILIFGLFLYIYLAQRLRDLYLNGILVIYLFVDAGFSYLFLSLALYYFYKRDNTQALFHLSLYLISVFFYGFVAHGIPKGYFLDLLGVYSAIFSPIVFVYIFYVLYRRFVIKQLDRVWFIATTVLIISIILSFRQKINLEYFAPYVMLALPLAANTFISTYRVRLKMFRKRYKAIFFFAFIFLLINSIVVFFNKELYLILENPKKHFIYNMDIAAPLAQKLKAQAIYCVESDKKMQLRLRFYGVSYCKENKLQELQLSNTQDANVTISYKGKILYQANVTKLNIK
jgi:hypothetical protein